MSSQLFPSNRTPRYVALFASTLAISLSLFQLWQPLVGFFPVGSLPFESILGQQPATYFRPIHLAWILVLGFVVYPVAKEQGLLRWLDALQAKAPGIRRTHLPFVGRNVVLWRGAAAAEDSAAPSGPLCEECLP